MIYFRALYSVQECKAKTGGVWRATASSHQRLDGVALWKFLARVH